MYSPTIPSRRRIVPHIMRVTHINEAQPATMLGFNILRMISTMLNKIPRIAEMIPRTVDILRGLMEKVVAPFIHSDIRLEKV